MTKDQGPGVEERRIAIARFLDPGPHWVASHPIDGRQQQALERADELEGILAALNDRPLPSVGWRVVPVELTDAMRNAAERAFLKARSQPYHMAASNIYAAVLSAAPPTSEVPSAWRPIATHPYDDEVCLLWREGDRQAYAGWWLGSEGTYEWAFIDETSGRSHKSVEPNAWLRGDNPTHWQPLPATPGAGSGGTGGDDRGTE